MGDEEDGSHEGHEGDEEEGSHEGHEGDEEEGSHEGMKAMKKKSVSKVAKGVMAKAMVLRGSKAKTVGGLTAKDLTKNKFGKIVSKKKSALGKKSPWIQAVAKARK